MLRNRRRIDRNWCTIFSIREFTQTLRDFFDQYNSIAKAITENTSCITTMDTCRVQTGDCNSGDMLKMDNGRVPVICLKNCASDCLK